MPVGDGLSARQRVRIEHAVELAERESDLRFSVWVGTVGASAGAGGSGRGLRVRAEQLHAASAEPARTVLVAVDPALRRLEIVTGAAARRSLDDRSCALASLTMTSCFRGGDLVGGIVQGLASLADHARRAPVLHLDQP